MTTNYERIKNMTVEEMAEFIEDITDCSFCEEYLTFIPEGTNCSKCPVKTEHYKLWLQSESECNNDGTI